MEGGGGGVRRGMGRGGGKTVLAVLLEEISSGIYVNI
jgi:hypothetical protein